jgi:hypothetical protein
MTTWMETVQNLLDTAVVDPMALLRPNAATDLVVGWAERAFEINFDLLRDLTGVSVTAEVAIGREITTAGASTAARPIEVEANEIEPAIDVEASDVEAGEVEPAEAGPVRSGKKATRGLIEADRQTHG